MVVLCAFKQQVYRNGSKLLFVNIKVMVISSINENQEKFISLTVVLIA